MLSLKSIAAAVAITVAGAGIANATAVKTPIAPVSQGQLETQPLKQLADVTIRLGFPLFDYGYKNHHHHRRGISPFAARRIAAKHVRMRVRSVDRDGRFYHVSGYNPRHGLVLVRVHARSGNVVDVDYLDRGKRRGYRGHKHHRRHDHYKRGHGKRDRGHNPWYDR